MANAFTESWASPVTATINKHTGKIDIQCGNTRISCAPDEAPTLAADLLDQFQAIQNALGAGLTGLGILLWANWRLDRLIASNSHGADSEAR